MDVVILAAGLGSRLKGLTKDKPKAMVTVAGKSLIDYALEFINSPEVEQVYVVGGYEFKVLEKHIQHKEKIKMIKNNDYQKGSTLTIDKVIHFLNKDFLIMNVDHIYPPNMFKKILKHKGSDKIIAMVDSDRNLVEDDMKVKLNSQKHIVRISKQLNEYDVGYIGMTFVGEKRVVKYKEALKNVIGTNESANAEAVLDNICEKQDIEVLDLSGFRWYEVDNQEDLKIAEKALVNEKEVNI